MHIPQYSKKMVTKPLIPQIKKKINAFLVGEEGEITKESLLKTGLVLSSIAIGSILASKEVLAGSHGEHNNNLSVTAAGAGSHGHAYHASHGDHGSHCSGSIN